MPDRVVDLIGGQGLLASSPVAPSRGGRLIEPRSKQWRDAVRVVVIDPHAGHRKAIRQALPHAQLVADRFPPGRAGQQEISHRLWRSGGRRCTHSLHVLDERVGAPPVAPPADPATNATTATEYGARSKQRIAITRRVPAQR